jgi:hypothetical protein
LNFEDVSCLRVRTLGKRPDFHDISLDLAGDSLIIPEPASEEHHFEPQQQRVSDAPAISYADGDGAAASPFGVEGGIDFLAFGDDVLVDEAGRGNRSNKKRTSSSVIEGLKKKDPVENKSSGTKRKFQFVKDFEGVLDESECEEIEQSIAANTTSAGSSSAMAMALPDQHHVEALASDDEEPTDPLNFVSKHFQFSNGP